MTPIWIFPAYPMLMVGPLGGILSSQLSPAHSLQIIVGGTTIQGVGFLMSLMVYSAFIYRLMSQKLPKENVRPGMFVSVGPSGFTVSGLVTMASNAHRCFPPDFMGDGQLAAKIVRVVANFGCLWMWGSVFAFSLSLSLSLLFLFAADNSLFASLALFFFFISISAHWSVIGPGRMVFTMGWYAFIFPNTSLVTATFAIGRAFDNKPILIIGCVMVFPLIMMYLFVFVMMVRAIVTYQILWPQRDEDKDEGGFEMKAMQQERPADPSLA